MKRFSLFIILTISIVLNSISIYAAEIDAVSAPHPTVELSNFETNNQNKNRRKVTYTNIALASSVVWYGFTNWEWGKHRFHSDNEAWLGADTKFGGADKFGHLYTGYLITRVGSSLYKSWGIPADEAVRSALISSLIFTSVMEIGDGFSSAYGFSYEDFASNTLGQFAGYYLETHPEIDKKIDIRLEYNVFADGATLDPTSDYNNMKYLIALKASGFKLFKKDSPLRYLELHLGYYTRGFNQSNNNSPPTRHPYIGIGINLSELFSRANYKKSAKFFEYIQIPGTYAEHP